MSPYEQRLWLATQRRVASLQPDVQRALLRAFQIIRESFTDAELARLIDSGQIDEVLTQVLSDVVMERAFIPYRERIRQTTRSGFQYAVPDLPKGGIIGGNLAVAFDYLSPTVITAIRTLETKVMTSLSSDVRETVRAFVENGLREGISPRSIGREIRTVIGMSPTQLEHAIAYEAKLVEADKMNAEQIAKAVERYRKRAISLNAETNARTATLDAYKRGQMLAWQSAIDKGIVPPGSLTKTWRGVMDSRERDEHVAMEGETQPFDQFYSNGELVPGDSTYNCRCISVIRVAA